MIQLKYFASLRDALGCGGEQLELPAGIDSVSALRAHLADRGADWARSLLNGGVLAAVNHEVASDDAALQDGDEVAFFPPVTGG